MRLIDTLDLMSNIISTSSDYEHRAVNSGIFIANQIVRLLNRSIRLLTECRCKYILLIIKRYLFILCSIHSAQNSLHFTYGILVHSDTNQTSLWSFHRAATSAWRLFAHIFPRVTISTTVCIQVLIYIMLCALGLRGENENAQALKR